MMCKSKQSFEYVMYEDILFFAFIKWVVSFIKEQWVNYSGNKSLPVHLLHLKD